MTSEAIETLLDLMTGVTLDALEARFASSPEISTRLADFRRYFDHLDRLAVRDWVIIDLKIVRGLAYYTGIVFELFDARGEMRAICGGGRYDNCCRRSAVLICRRLVSAWATWCSPTCCVSAATCRSTRPRRSPTFGSRRRPMLYAAMSSRWRLCFAGRSFRRVRAARAVLEQAAQGVTLRRSHLFRDAPGGLRASHRVVIDAFAETAAPTLAELLGPEPPTIERLVAVIREHPQILSSTL
jgi:hypothetical protein